MSNAHTVIVINIPL